MASTGVIILGVIVVAGAAAVATKPEADGFAPALMEAAAESAPDNAAAREVASAMVERCNADAEACANVLRTGAGDQISESDYFVARHVVVGGGGDGAAGSCIGAYTMWWCSADEAE